MLPEEFSEWEGRIVGGSNAGSGQFPYQVSLRSAANGHFCGGSIISNRYALSAAHCTIGRTTANTRVVVGTHLLNSGGVSHMVQRIVNHGQYNGNTLANDVSLVQTQTNIVYNNLVQPIGLGSVFVGGGVGVAASGWGQTSVSFLQIDHILESPSLTFHHSFHRIPDQHPTISNSPICKHSQTPIVVTVSVPQTPTEFLTTPSVHSQETAKVCAWEIPAVQLPPVAMLSVLFHGVLLALLVHQMYLHVSPAIVHGSSTMLFNFN